MKKQIKITAVVLTLGFLSVAAHAEFGVSAGASFNFKADFRNATTAQGLVNDPGADSAGVDHIYDDGYNRVDSSGNAGNQTTYWGYQNASQYDPTGDSGNGTITMSSIQSVIDAGSSSGKQTEAQPAIEIYWQEDLTDNERLNLGFRTALCWQRINLEHRMIYHTISDTYSLDGSIPPGAPYNGPFLGPGVLLSDNPDRSIYDIYGSRKIEADLFGLNIGPTLSFNISEKLSLSASVGGTAAWIDSEFSYEDTGSSSGRAKDSEWLFGAYASADLKYKLGEHWGIFGGATYIRLEDFEQQVDGCVGELQSDDSYTVRAGLFFE